MVRCVSVQLWAALVLGWALPPPAGAPPPATACVPLCLCRDDHIACNEVPFHRFPLIEAGVRHVSVSGARLGALEATALDARALTTLVLVASHLHHIEHAALQSMVSSLASLDLGYNEFTEVPVEALCELKVLNWLNLQNNLIDEVDAETEWGSTGESLSSLSLANNRLVSLGDGALAALRRLVQLDLEGNRLVALAASALPPSVALLRLSDNLLPELPCAALGAAPRLRALHLRANALRPTLAPAANVSCRVERAPLDSLDLAQNDLDDAFSFPSEFRHRMRPRHLILDLNDFTSIPSFALESGRLERLSMSYNRVRRVSAAALRALARDLVQLDLEHNELRAPPAGLRALTQLRRLSLAYNHMQELGTPPPRLHHLSLAGNYLSSVPRELADLEPATLAYLDLGYNSIAALVPEAFGAWAEALTTLNLRGNRITHLAADAFPAKLPLRELVLSFNDLYQVEPGALHNLTALQTLELSSTPFGGEFPAITAPRLTWLSLDNDEIHRVTSDHLLNFPLLEYLNLDFNKINEFPGESFGPNGSRRLRELRLSYNYINSIGSGFLREVPELQSVDLSFNRVREVGAHAFESLPRLRQLSLAGNLLRTLAPRAFAYLPRLEALDLHDNRLATFSTACFDTVAGELADFSVNVSRNLIAALVAGEGAVPIAVLDLSHNRLENVDGAFFKALGAHVRHVSLAHNHLTHIDSGAFGALPALRILSLEGNAIVAVKRRAFAATPALHTLDLSQNALQQLVAEQFHGLRNLRHLYLVGNRLRALPRDCFANTVLEHLDLTDNRLAIFPSGALAGVGFTLRRLELARNRLEHLDAAMFGATAFLRELSLAHNALTVLADNALAPLPRLRALDLSGNRLKANFEELLRGVPRLRRLALAEAGLRAAPALPLPDLVELDLAGNRLTALREGPTRLRTLRLAGNAFTSLRPAMWATLPRLVDLDVSANPIVRLASGSLEGLPRLLRLRADRLRRLDAIEPRAFRSLGALRDLTLETPVAGAASLADVVACIPSLEQLTLAVRSPELGAQLRGVRARRLRSLEVRGSALVRLSGDAFAGVGGSRALTLRVRGTGVAALPAGLTRPLMRVPHLALDFSDNRLVSFSPSILYPNATGRKRLTTKLLLGGLVVGGNPLSCGCGVRWVGAWLRRWTAEVGGGGGGARAAARASTCVQADGTRAALVTLEADEAQCRASALSARATPRSSSAAARVLALAALLRLMPMHASS